MMIEKLPDELHRHEATLFAIVRDGLARFTTQFAAQRPTMTKRSERSNIHDCILAEAAKYFEIKERMNLRTIKIDPYRLKVKLMNKHLRTRNIPTQMVFDFLRQQVARLFGVDTIAVHLGYVPDELDVADSTIWITEPNGTKLKWYYELTGGAGAKALPALPITKPDVPAPRRFKPKRDTKRKKA